MPRYRLAAPLALVLVLAALLAAQATPAARRSLAPYSGTGSWVSLYDTAAWRSPERVVRTLAAHHVHTLFLETSNYRQQTDLVRPATIGRFLDAAHAAGIAVVGWYLPSLANPRRDLRRARAAVDFRSAGGERLDSVALDIEATTVRSLALRNARAVQLAAALRRAVPPGYPLGAITIAPVGASPTYWPDYPFRRLARDVDVFLPMEYFTARAHGAARVGAYSVANLLFIRTRIGNPSFPIHPIGGEADRATLAELGAFFRAVTSCGTVGTSLWEYGQTTRGEWLALKAATDAGGAAHGSCG